MLTFLIAALASHVLAQPITTVDVEKPWNDSNATVAESSNWEATSTHAQVVALLDQLAKNAPDVARRVSFGKSVEGRDLPVIILSDPPVATAAEAKALADKEGRVIVFLFGNIHAGEVDAKEAYLILARQLIEAHATTKMAGSGPAAPDADLLKKLIVCIAPIYNADGNDRFGPPEKNRPQQDGPIKGMGQRHNAMDLDLNRDWGKLESPEARGIVKFLNEWDPHVVVDGHTTNGSYHRNLITYAVPKALAGDERLNTFAREWLPKIGASLRARTDIDTFWYGDFEGEHENPPRTHEIWSTPPAMPRYSTHYVGMRGRIGILSESYSYSTYKARIVGSLEFAREILRACVKNSAEIRVVTRQASEAGAGIGGLLREVVIRTKESSAGRAIVKGWVEETIDGRARATSRPKDYDCVLMDRVEGTLSVKRPAYYAFTTSVPGVIENLRMHGVTIEMLDKDTRARTEVYTIDSAKSAANKWQGHVLVSVEATPTPKTLTLPQGTVIVRTNQPLGNLVCYWLEPECEDGLTTWNFFDEWCAPGKVFPVVRVMRD
jgi:hypothetical protein